jgi:hypothetical protein
MSRVISFRLNPDNLREDQALEILQTHQANGYSIRHIITEALLKFDEINPEQTDVKLDELKTNLELVSLLLGKLCDESQTDLNTSAAHLSNLGLADSFIASVKESVKSGMNLD